MEWITIPHKTLPKADQLYFHGYIVADSGFIFDFDNIIEEANYADCLKDYLQEKYSAFQWKSKRGAADVSETINTFAPPAVTSFLRVKLDNYFSGSNQFELKYDNETNIAIEFNDIHASYFPFNTMIISFRVYIPEQYWTNIDVLRFIRDFITSYNAPNSYFGLNLEGIFNPVVAECKQMLAEAVPVAKVPELKTPYLDLKMLIDKSKIISWTHAVLVALMPEPFEPDSPHFQSYLLNNTAAGIRNFTLYHGDFAYVENSDSLICVPSTDQKGHDVNEQVYLRYLQWIRLHQYSWKMTWEIDRGLYSVLNKLSLELKYRRSQITPEDIYTVNTLINYIKLSLELHRPRNISSGLYTQYFLECIAEAWQTDNIIEDMDVKMKDLQSLVGQLNQLKSDKRARYSQKFLASIGVFGLGTMLISYLNTVSFGEGISDYFLTAIVGSMILAFVIIAQIVTK